MTTATHDHDMLAIRARFFAAVTSGNIDGVRACYAPEAIVWHNTDGIEQSVEANLRVLAWIAKNVKDFRYEDVRCQPTSIGFVEQHLTRGIGPGGAPFAVPACIVCTVADGRITRVDEYLDSDAVFGVKQALVVDFEERPADHPLAHRYGFDTPFFEARYDFVLEQT